MISFLPILRPGLLGFFLSFTLCFQAGAAEPGLPSGFGREVTPAERRLAEKPQPDAWFREMAGDWHGVPGLPRLRERWLRLAGGRDPQSSSALSGRRRIRQRVLPE